MIMLTCHLRLDFPKKKDMEISAVGIYYILYIISMYMINETLVLRRERGIRRR